MHLTIDNLDGRGAVDYTAAVVAEEHNSTLSMRRSLQEPPVCTATLLPGPAGLAVPVRHARITVTSAAGAVLFTGTLAAAPVRTFAGSGSCGPVLLADISAMGDAPLLDPVAPAQRPLLLGDRAPLTTRLAARLNSGAATSTPGVTHVLRDGDRDLRFDPVPASSARELAGDITLSGETEPGPLVTECFLGDGVTNVFTAGSAFFHDGNTTLLHDTFRGEALDDLLWSAGDPGSHLSLTGSGITLNGGTGADGQTSLAAREALEMGGSLVLELRGVQLGAASDGVLAGLYQGTLTLADCFAGFRVRQTVSGTGSSTTLVPLLNGVETGSTYTPLAGHSYTLRLRLHCVEQQRVMHRYLCLADGVVQSFGSAGGVDAPMDVVFELVDEGVSSNTPATILYDTAATGTALSGTPATCIFALASAKQMFCSVASVRVSRFGSAWVTGTLPNGTSFTRLLGGAGDGVDCVVTNGGPTEPGKLTFLPGRVPLAGERVTVQYRTPQRSVARLQAAGAAGRWLGRVVSPPARSSVDCASAALAALSFAGSTSAALAGTYSVANPDADIAPGDLLAFPGGSLSPAALVKSVEIVDGAAQPEVLHYRVQFANDRATQRTAGLACSVSDDIAADAVLPATAALSPTPALANLQRLSIVSLTTSELHLDAGTTAPAGGGFEVRRRDAAFGRADADLVLRSPVRGLSIPRVQENESFYVRMYDGSTPPVFSRFSSAVLVHAPVS